MSAPGRKRYESVTTREDILDATESILRKEGYAAVSSRRIATEAGLKSRTIHYYFGSMDDLFIAVCMRINERHFAAYEQELETASLDRLWSRMISGIDSALLAELSALANHREAIREITVEALERARRYDARAMERFIAESGMADGGLSPTALSVFMAGLIRVINAERSIGMFTGHEEALAFISGLMRREEQVQSPSQD